MQNKADTQIACISLYNDVNAFQKVIKIVNQWSVT